MLTSWLLGLVVLEPVKQVHPRKCLTQCKGVKSNTTRKKLSYCFQLLMSEACCTTKSRKGKQKTCLTLFDLFNCFSEKLPILNKADALTGCELFESEDISCRISDMLLRNSKDPFTVAGNTCKGIPTHHRQNFL